MERLTPARYWRNRTHMGIVAIVFGLILALLFFLTGAGICGPTNSPLPPLAAAFGYFAGNSLLLVLSYIATMTGLHFVAKDQTDEGAYPAQEVAMAAISGLASFFLVFVFVGGVSEHTPQTTSVFFGGAALECLLSVYLGINLSRHENRLNWLYYLACATTLMNFLGLGAILVFLGGV